MIPEMVFYTKVFRIIWDKIPLFNPRKSYLIFLQISLTFWVWFKLICMYSGFFDIM